MINEEVEEEKAGGLYNYSCGGPIVEEQHSNSRKNKSQASKQKSGSG